MSASSPEIVEREPVTEAHGLLLAPIQACPQCDYWVRARRIASAHTRKSGRSEIAFEYGWTGQQCPDCGVRLQRRCDGCSRYIVRVEDACCPACGRRYPWSRRWRTLAKRILLVEDITIWTLVGDITSIAVNAIVAATDGQGRMVSEVAAALRERANFDIEASSRAQASQQEIEAVHLPGGDLPAQYVILTAILDADLGTDVDRIAEGTLRSLRLAEELPAQTVALPALGTGAAGLPIPDSAEAMGAGLSRFLRDDPSAVSDVVFVLPGEIAADFAEALRRVLH